MVVIITLKTQFSLDKLDLNPLNYLKKLQRLYE